MNIQLVIVEAYARADANDDGKLSVKDIQSMADDHGLDKHTLDTLKAQARQNEDGKLTPDEVGQLLKNPGGVLNGLS